jgi:hypothetical protein
MAKTQRSTGKREDGANLSARGRAGLKRHAEACIDTFLTSVGIKDPSDQTDKNGWRHFQLGSARGFAYVVETDDDVIVHAAAKVMDLPSDKDLTLPLASSSFPGTFPAICRPRRPRVPSHGGHASHIRHLRLAWHSRWQPQTPGSRGRRGRQIAGKVPGNDEEASGKVIYLITCLLWRFQHLSLIAEPLD